MMRRIELFLRGEFWLHLATMFFAMVLLIQVALLCGYYLPNWLLFTITGFVALGWEVAWKMGVKKPIDFRDILGTCVGGALAILILRI